MTILCRRWPRLLVLAMLCVLAATAAVAVAPPAQALPPNCEFTPDGTVCDEPPPPPPNPPGFPVRCDPQDPLFPLNPLCVPQTTQPGLPGPFADVEVSDFFCPPSCSGPFVVAMTGGIVDASRITYNLVRAIGVYETNRASDLLIVKPRQSDLRTVAGVRANLATYEQATIPYVIDALLGDPALRRNTDADDPLRHEPIEPAELRRARARVQNVDKLVDAVYAAYKANPVTSGAPVETFIAANAGLIASTGLSQANVRTMFASAELRATVFAAIDRIEARTSTIQAELAKIPVDKRLGLPDGSLRGYLKRKTNWGEHKAAWKRLAVQRFPDSLGQRIEAFGNPDDPLALASSVVLKRVLSALNGVRCASSTALCDQLTEREIIIKVATRNNPKEKGYAQGVLKIYCKFFRGDCQPIGPIGGADSRNQGGVAFTGIGGRCVEIAGADRTSGPVQLNSCSRQPEQLWSAYSDGTLRSLDKCLDAFGTTNGAPVRQFVCASLPSQTWQLVGDRVVNAASGRCLDAVGGSSADGTRLQLFDCHGGANQSWSVPVETSVAEQFGGAEGTCVESADGVVDNGTPTQLARCDRNFRHQDWAFYTDGTLRASGKCLDAAGAGTSNGTRVNLFDCHGGPNQLWRPGGGGLLVNPVSNRCLDAVGGDTSTGTPLQLSDCSGAAGQRWALPSLATTAAGRFGALGGTCVEVADGDASAGTVQLNSCTGGDRQGWAVHTDGTIRTLGACLSPVGDGVDSGNPVALAECTADLTQQWQVTPQGTVVNVGSQRCLDAVSGSAAPGTRLQVFDCHGGSNQMWSLPR
jgi:hypothetical protein